MIWLLALLNLLFVVSDALRDNVIDRKPGVSWDRYHFPKWVSFYGQQCLIILLGFLAGLIPYSFTSLWLIVLYAVLCGLAWRIAYISE